MAQSGLRWMLGTREEGSVLLSHMLKTNIDVSKKQILWKSARGDTRPRIIGYLVG